MKELPNQCLGVFDSGKRCEARLPLGKHFCKDCKKRLDSLSGRGVKRINRANERSRVTKKDIGMI